MKKIAWMIPALLLLVSPAFGAVQYNRHIDITLSDGTTVRCFPEAVHEPPSRVKAGGPPPQWNQKIQYPQWADDMKEMDRMRSKRAMDYWKKRYGVAGAVKKGAANGPQKFQMMRAVIINYKSFGTKNFYYLPMEPRISFTKEGDPNFSMIRFVTDKSKAHGGVEGAILDFLVEYGLTPQQKGELEKKLQEKIQGAKLMGSVPLDQGSEGNTFSIVSATLGDKGFTSNLITSGKAPVMEGQKAAVAARLTQYGATLLEKSLKMPTTDISVVFDLKYIAVLPAYDVDIIIDYSKYQTITKQREVEHKQWKSGWKFLFWGSKKTHVRHTDVQEMMDALTENGIVKIVYKEYIPDSDKELVDAGIYQIVIQSFFDMQKRIGQPEMEEPGKKDEKGKVPGGEDVKYFELKRKRISRTSRQVLSMKKSKAIYVTHTMTGNVGGWYEKFKGNPKCFASINLDDPFFQRRELRFVIDNAAYDIFQNIFNYATVKVRKARSSGPAFEDEFTIDKKYLEEHGQTAVMTFARMGEKGSDQFEYAAQWSMRGGKLFPEHPQWKKGDVMAVTLAAPIEPLTIEVEGDLNDLQAGNYTRAAVQFRYMKFGRLFEDPESASVSVAKGTAVVEKKIFHDAGNAGFDYRIFLYHKNRGKIPVGGWQRGEGNYVFCPVPAKTSSLPAGSGLL